MKRTDSYMHYIDGPETTYKGLEAIAKAGKWIAGASLALALAMPAYAGQRTQRTRPACKPSAVINPIQVRFGPDGGRTTVRDGGEIMVDYDGYLEITPQTATITRTDCTKTTRTTELLMKTETADGRWQYVADERGNRRVFTADPNTGMIVIDPEKYGVRPNERFIIENTYETPTELFATALMYVTQGPEPAEIVEPTIPQPMIQAPLQPAPQPVQPAPAAQAAATVQTPPRQEYDFSTEPYFLATGLAMLANEDFLVRAKDPSNASLGLYASGAYRDTNVQGFGDVLFLRDAREADPGVNRIYSDWTRLNAGFDVRFLKFLVGEGLLMASREDFSQSQRQPILVPLDKMHSLGFVGSAGVFFGDPDEGYKSKMFGQALYGWGFGRYSFDMAEGFRGAPMEPSNVDIKHHFKVQANLDLVELSYNRHRFRSKGNDFRGDISNIEAKVFVPLPFLSENWKLTGLIGKHHSEQHGVKAIVIDYDTRFYGLGITYNSRK